MAVGARAVDVRAAAVGSAATLAIVLPTVIVVRALQPGDDSPLWVVVMVAVLVAFPVGGAVAAGRSTGSAFATAAAAAVGAWLVNVAITLARGGLSFAGFLTLVVLMQVTIALAVGGAWVSRRRHDRAGPA